MADKHIPIEAVRNALMTAKVKAVLQRSADGKPLARFAAFSAYPMVNIACREARHGHKPYKLPPCHFGPMWRGDIVHLIDRVRWNAGLREVERTWGKRLRALQAEVDTGVMR